MCQLLGMSANTPTDIVFSFEGFRKRGGLTDHHEDGFGIAFFEDGGLRLFHDDKPSAESPVGDLIRHYPIKSLNVMAHIRRATRGGHSLVNTHPFMRELWGEYWVFAHNGQLDYYAAHFETVLGGNPPYTPVGTTDSEDAFCYVLTRLKQHFPTKPNQDALFPVLTDICRELANFGMFNCLLSNGEWQLCFATSLLHYITRKAPFGVAQLIDTEQAIDFGAVTTPNDIVTVMATTPLTDNETWQPLHVGECVVFSQGQRIYQNCPERASIMSIADGIALAKKIGACD